MGEHVGSMGDWLKLYSAWLAVTDPLVQFQKMGWST